MAVAEMMKDIPQIILHSELNGQVFAEKVNHRSEDSTPERSNSGNRISTCFISPAASVTTAPLEKGYY